MTALLFGSIGTLADTSELQRDAFNAAFVEHGLDWRWEHDDYVEMLRSSGGSDRVAVYAAQRGQDVDVAAVHATKSRLFQDRLASGGVSPRAGAAEAIDAARAQGVSVALVTTTEPANVAALLAALSPRITAEHFDLIVDTTSVSAPKPDPAAYLYAVKTLGQDASACVALEDNEGGLAAAAAAGVTCVAFPNTNTQSHEFAAAATRVSSVDLDQLTALVTHDGRSN
ncbi:HAD-IA family hydrolase [Dermatophilaceae bacterium Soc4.6]